MKSHASVTYTDKRTSTMWQPLYTSRLPFR